MGAADLRRTRELHPAFNGCFDWHSAVHSHWLLVRLLRLLPALPQAEHIRSALNEHLTVANLRTEAACFACRVLPAADFAVWFAHFLPSLAEGGPPQLLTPTVVSDRSDGQVVDLDGLNLSRAWRMC